MRPFRFAAYASSLIAAAALVLTGTGQAQAAENAASVDYVALGDSYSSGVGAGNYDSASGSCKRTSRAYPALWAAAHSPASFSFKACSGARTGDVVAGQLTSLTAATDLVSITVGGNDAGFADVMTTCVTQSEAKCLARIAEARAYADTTLPGRLDSVYTAVRSKAPNARVAVLGYPRFYKLSGTCVAGLTEKERAAINGGADHLNSVTAKRAADHGFAYGDVTTTFTGHEICSSSPWLHSVNWLNIGESYHPKAAGQSGGYLPVFAAIA